MRRGEGRGGERAHVRNCMREEKREIVITLLVFALFTISSRQGDDDDDALPLAFAMFEGKWEKMSLAGCVELACFVIARDRSSDAFTSSVGVRKRSYV